MSSELEPEIPVAPRRRRLAPLLAVSAAALSVAGYFGVRSLAEPAPLRVVVAVDLDGHFWQDSRPSAVLVNELCQRLDASGFEPVRAGDPEVLEVLSKAKDADEAARKLHASFVITAKLTPEVIEHDNLGETRDGKPRRGFEARVDGAIEVHHVGEESPGKGRLVSWAGAADKAEALRLLGKGLGSQAFDQILPRLVEHPSIQAIFKSDDIKLADKVSKAKKYVEARNARLEEARTSYADLEKRRKEFDKGPAKVTYHSAISSQDGLGAVSSQGLLVKTADVTPFVVPRTLELNYIAGLETLEWRDPAAGRKTPLWAGYHLFSYPSATPGGGPVVFVEDLFGWAKTITVVTPDGKFRRVRTDAEHRFVDPKIAPGGAACALYDRPCHDCRANLLVVSLDSGKALFERQSEEGSVYSGFGWLGPQKLAYLFTPPPADHEGAEEPRVELHVADLSKSPPEDEVVYRTNPGKSLGSLEASRDGKRLVMEYFDGWARLGVFDLEEKNFSSHDAGFEARGPSFSPDGATVAYVRGGDVFLYDLRSKQSRRLTKNPWRERYPIFSEDGARVYFESQGEDPLFDRRTLSLVGSVAVKDAGEPGADAAEEKQ